MVKIEISDSALDYLKSLAKPLEDTTVTVFDRIVREHQAKQASEIPGKANTTLSFGIADMPDVTFTTISKATINNSPLIKKDWNTVLAKLIEICVKEEGNLNNLISLLDANIIPSEPDEDSKKKGFRYVPKAKLSFQGLDAIRACRNIMILSQNYSVPVDLTIKWSSSEKADFPGKTAIITLP